MKDPQPHEVDWYKRRGQYPAERIAKDGDGRPYVIGDASWNRRHPDKEEWVEPLMAREIRHLVYP